MIAHRPSLLDSAQLAHISDPSTNVACGAEITSEWVSLVPKTRVGGQNYL
jgi:hypothetical protein